PPYHRASSHRRRSAPHTQSTHERAFGRRHDGTRRSVPGRPPLRQATGTGRGRRGVYFCAGQELVERYLSGQETHPIAASAVTAAAATLLGWFSNDDERASPTAKPR